MYSVLRFNKITEKNHKDILNILGSIPEISNYSDEFDLGNISEASDYGDEFDCFSIGIYKSKDPSDHFCKVLNMLKVLEKKINLIRFDLTLDIAIDVEDIRGRKIWGMILTDELMKYLIIKNIELEITIYPFF